MDITIDGIIYESQFQGGISRVYDEILPRMCDQDSTLEIKLVTSGSCKKMLPVHPRIVHERLLPIDDMLRPIGLWSTKRFGIRSYWHFLTGKMHQKGIWHSTNFTLPYGWRGPVLLSVYDMMHERFAQRIFNMPIHQDLRAYRKACIASADMITCISETTKLDLEEYAQVDPAKVKVVHLAASPVFRRLDSSGRQLFTGNSRPFLLYVGSRSTYKNFQTLLVAFGRWQRRKEFELVVVGPPWNKDEMKTIAELKLDQQVSIRIHVSDEELCVLYNLASALVFPSLYEGFGIPLVEAMACGCPIVGSRIPTTVEVAGTIPIYFNPCDINSFVSALDCAVQEGRDSERERLGLDRAQQFSWDRTANETLGIYQMLNQSAITHLGAMPSL